MTMLRLPYWLITGSILLCLLPHLLSDDGIHASVSKGPGDRVPLYLLSRHSLAFPEAFPWTNSRHNHNDGDSTIRGHATNTKHLPTTSSSASASSIGFNRDGISCNDNFKKDNNEGQREEDEYHISDFTEHSTLPGTDCSVCVDLQELVAYDQDTDDVSMLVPGCILCPTG